MLKYEILKLNRFLVSRSPRTPSTPSTFEAHRRSHGLILQRVCEPVTGFPKNGQSGGATAATSSKTPNPRSCHRRSSHIDARRNLIPG